MPVEHEHPTGWEKARDNVTPFAAVVIVVIMWMDYMSDNAFRAEMRSELNSLGHRVGRLEVRLDRAIENGTGEDRR